MTLCQQFPGRLLVTADGSHTVEVPALGATYHSIHGAIRESRHIFVDAGLRSVAKAGTATGGEVRVLEVGFGTGLNAFLMLQTGVGIYFETLEPFPLTEAEAALLNYPDILGNKGLFMALHAAAWEEKVRVAPGFVVRKTRTGLAEFTGGGAFDLICHDAFSPDVQPELWTTDIFRKLHGLLKPGGVWISYCSKGAVRRALLEARFLVEKLPGPPGKREILRAVRQS